MSTNYLGHSNPHTCSYFSSLPDRTLLVASTSAAFSHTVVNMAEWILVRQPPPPLQMYLGKYHPLTKAPFGIYFCGEPNFEQLPSEPSWNGINALVIASCLLWVVTHVIKNIVKRRQFTLMASSGCVPGWLYASILDNVLNTGFRATAFACLLWVAVQVHRHFSLEEKEEVMVKSR